MFFEPAGRAAGYGEDSRRLRPAETQRARPTPRSPAARAARVVVVEDARDGLGRQVAAALTGLGHKVSRYDVESLAHAPFSWGARGLWIGGEPVDAFSFHPRPAFGAALERPPSVGPIWVGLHALELPLLNRVDAEVWAASLEWPIWRRRFALAGVAVAPVEIDGPRGGSGPRDAARSRAARGVDSRRRGHRIRSSESGVRERVVVCCGEVVGGVASPTARRVAALGRAWGLRLLGLLLDEADALVTCTAFPTLLEHETPVVGDRVARDIDEDLARR